MTGTDKLKHNRLKELIKEKGISNLSPKQKRLFIKLEAKSRMKNANLRYNDGDYKSYKIKSRGRAKITGALRGAHYGFKNPKDGSGVFSRINSSLAESSRRSKDYVRVHDMSKKHEYKILKKVVKAENPSPELKAKIESLKDKLDFVETTMSKMRGQRKQLIREGRPKSLIANLDREYERLSSQESDISLELRKLTKGW